MCGIAGAINGSKKLNIARCYESLARRGPDQRGVWSDETCTLIHTRLAVVDVENGLQPMKLRFGGEDYILVYNGELYNTPELRAELTALGHIFTERSDTEVLLHAYAEWSDKCVEHFNGIFAFAIWERKAKRLFIARDRIGVKPFFYSLRGGAFIFGSEIKALLALGVEPEIDGDGIAELILLAPGRTPGCGVFKHISELKPGYCGYVGGGEIQIRNYWSLTDREHRDTFSQTVEKVRALVLDAITRQLVSDVPICTFLSGGLDSSTISSVASLKLPELHTFTVDYVNNDKYFIPGKFQPNSDSDYVVKMNDYIGNGSTNHRILLNSTELADALYDAVDARDLPGMADVDSSLLLFCREIKKHATVALSGECADEIFAGYPWYRDPTIRAGEGFPWAQSTEYRSEFLRPDYNINAAEFVNSRYRETVNSADVLPGANSVERRMREMVRLNFNWFMQTLLDNKDAKVNSEGLYRLAVI